MPGEISGKKESGRQEEGKEQDSTDRNKEKVQREPDVLPAHKGITTKPLRLGILQKENCFAAGGGTCARRFRKRTERMILLINHGHGI